MKKKLSSVKPPAAPSAYRPQPVPKVLQKKSVTPQPQAIVQSHKSVTPPPVNHSKQKNAVIQRSRYGRGATAPQPRKLEYTGSTESTFCAMVLYRHDLTLIEERVFSSGGGLHAEQKMLLRLFWLVVNGTLTPQNAGVKDYIVYLALSKSPCSSTSVPPTRSDGLLGCLERLNNLNANGITTGGVTVTFAVQLAATKPYQGKVAGGKAASRNNYQGFGGGGGGSFGFVR